MQYRRQRRWRANARSANLQLGAEHGEDAPLDNVGGIGTRRLMRKNPTCKPKPSGISFAGWVTMAISAGLK